MKTVLGVVVGSLLVHLALVGGCAATTDAPASASHAGASPQGDAAGIGTSDVDRILVGDLAPAIASLRKRVADDPTDLRATVLLGIADAKVAAATAKLSKDPAMERMIVAKTFDRTSFTGRAPIAATPSFELVVRKSQDAVGYDDQAWLARNGLSNRVITLPPGKPGKREIPPGDLPEFVPASLGGQPVFTLYRHEDHTVAVYGDFFLGAPYLGVFAKDKAPRVYDLRNVVQPAKAIPLTGPAATEARGRQPDLPIRFAQLVGDTLVVALWKNGYAKNVDGKNGYVVALGPQGDVLWASAPVVADAMDFQVIGSHAVVAYGFRNEAMNLSVLDLRTGEIERSTELDSFPRRIERRGDDLHVLTDETERVLSLPENAPAAPPADLDAGAALGPPTLTGQARADLDDALDAVARHDAAAVRDRANRLATAGDELVTRGLERAAALLEAAAEGTGVDLTAAPLVRVAAPPWTHVVMDPEATAPSTRAPVVTEIAKRPPLGNPFPKAPLAEDSAFVLPPIDRGALPLGAPKWIPSHYGLEDLRAAIPRGDVTMLVYGGRYVVSVRGKRAERAFDLDALRHPPDPEPDHARFAIQDVTDAKLDRGVLYVSNGGGSYAKEARGKKGYMTALDYATGELVWRSDPLVSDAPFELHGEFILTAYGFTNESNYVYVLARATGETVSRTSIVTSPRWLFLDGHRLTIEGTEAGLDFSVR